MGEFEQQSFADRARELNDQRLRAVMPLVEAHTHVLRLREELAAAEKNRDASRAAALSAGWSDGELRELALDDAPKKRRRRRPAQPSSLERATSESPSPPVEGGDAVGGNTSTS